jgi:hypothetical protein
MVALDRMAGPAFRPIFLPLAGGLIVVFVTAAALAILCFSRASGAETPAEYINGLALAASLLVVLAIADQHESGSSAKMFWWLMAAGLGVLACNEVFDVFQLFGGLPEDDYIDLVVLFVTPLALLIACRVEKVPPVTLSAMKLGLALQCFSNIVDLSDNGQSGVFGLNTNVVEIAAELAELAFTEVYLFGLGYLLASILWRDLTSLGNPSEMT